jgi:hypothetical protein
MWEILIFGWFPLLKIQINSQKIRFWKEKSVEDVATLGPTAQATLVMAMKWISPLFTQLWPWYPIYHSCMCLWREIKPTVGSSNQHHMVLELHFYPTTNFNCISFTALVLQGMIPSPHLTQFYVIRDEYWKLLYFDLQRLFNDLGSLTELFSIKWGDFESIFIWDIPYAAFLLCLYCEIFSLEHNRHDPAIHLVAKQYTIRTPQGSIIGQSHLRFEKPLQWSWKLSGWKHGLGKPWCTLCVFGTTGFQSE